MNNDRSYERYKQYRINKYTYEQNQILFPLTLIAIGMAIISFWKYILIAILVVSVIVVIALVIHWQLKKNIVGNESIVLTEEEAKEGVTAHINVKYNASQAKLDLDIPPNVKDGDKFVVKDVVFENENGRRVKKRLHLKVKIS